MEEEKKPGIQVEERTIVEVFTSDGQKLKTGDEIMIRVRSEDIICTFEGIDRTYFVTQTLDGSSINKYRFQSVKNCRKVSIGYLELTENQKEENE